MKVCIYGAGAIGGYLAVPLSLSGVEVSCIARGAHLAAMRKNGLTLLVNGEKKVARPLCTDHVEDVIEEGGHPDYVIVTLKAHSVPPVVEHMKRLLGNRTAVVWAVNGLPWWYFYKVPGPFENKRLETVDPGGKLWDGIGPARVIGCTVYPATEVVEPGVIKHIEGDRFVLGEPTGETTERVSKLAEALSAAGFTARVRDNIRDDIWVKLWGNLSFNPISALTCATLDVIATDPGTRAVARAMMLEAQAIGEKVGAHFRVDVDRRIDGAAAVGPHKTSMLQDLERGRPLEIDALVASVQEMGRLVDADSAVIDTVLALVQQRARVAGLY